MKPCRKPKQQTAATVPASPAMGNVASLTADPRLPAPSTLVQKNDRHGVVRCECKVEEGGIRYAGSVYRSNSSAALAAARSKSAMSKAPANLSSVVSR